MLDRESATSPPISRLASSISRLLAAARAARACFALGVCFGAGLGVDLGRCVAFGVARGVGLGLDLGLDLGLGLGVAAVTVVAVPGRRVTSDAATSTATHRFMRAASGTREGRPGSPAMSR